MAKVKLMPLARGLRGRLGDVACRRWRHKIIAQTAPRHVSKPRSPAQLAGQAFFSEASRYAQAIRQDPAAMAFYRALYKRDQDNSWRGVVMGDYLHPPEVRAIDLSRYRGQPGDEIVVEALDDGEVLRVAVTIRGEDGAVLEQGEARVAPAGWLYVAQAAAPPGMQPTVTAVAYDYPGHAGELSLALPDPLPGERAAVAHPRACERRAVADHNPHRAADPQAAQVEADVRGAECAVRADVRGAECGVRAEVPRAGCGGDPPLAPQTARGSQGAGRHPLRRRTCSGDASGSPVWLPLLLRLAT